MGFDYFVELEIWSDAGAADGLTVRYFRAIADEDRQQQKRLRNQWSNDLLQMSPQEPPGALCDVFLNPSVDLEALPPYSFWLRFSFTLEKPYISRDEHTFYIIDNPIVRDSVFHLPMVRATNWKGNLRAALWQMGHGSENAPEVRRLLGEIRGDNDGRAGRVFFYPTFFRRVGLEVINPHDRSRRVGKTPILIETVPLNTEGNFTLLYVPCDLLGKAGDVRSEIGEDLVLLTQAIRGMFRDYGFSAKRTSGFGIAAERIQEGFVEMRFQEKRIPGGRPTPGESRSTQALPKYLIAPGQLKPEYLNYDGTFRHHTEQELAQMSKSARQEYDKAKKWWEREGSRYAAESKPSRESPKDSASDRRWLRREFDSFSKLVTVAQEIREQLKQSESEQ